MTIRGLLANTLPYLATMAWALVAFLAGYIVTLIVLLHWWSGDLQSLVAAQYDGAVVTLSVLVLNPVIVAVLLLAVRLRGANPIEYLALLPPTMRSVTVGIVGIVIIIALTDALLFVTGHAIVSDFQVVSYTLSLIHI